MPIFIVRQPISKLVDKQSIDDFRQKGVTVLRGAFTGWVDVLRAGIDANMNDPIQMPVFTKVKMVMAVFC